MKKPTPIRSWHSLKMPVPSPKDTSKILDNKQKLREVEDRLKAKKRGQKRTK